MITCNLRESTSLTGSLGVATITSFGDATAEAADILAGETAYVATGKVTGTYEPLDTSDATALATDILSPKTAYVDGAKITGTSTFDADTSDADAVESDIMAGKTAYADGEKLTGTNTNNADTTDATLNANDMLYGVTGYGADGTKLTGAGAYWQKVKWLYGTFAGSDIAGDIEIYAPNATLYREIFLNCTALTGIKLTYNGTMGGTSSSMFSGCTSLVTIDCELNCASATSLASVFQYCAALQTVRFTASSVKADFSFANSPLLSNASLLSIANGLNAASAKTLKMHATSITNMDAIIVDNNAGVAEPGSTMTLSAFINDIKGWSIT